MSGQYDVVILGYGPVGATLANLLGPSGLSICVIERDLVQFALPRAGHFDDEVMRIWQSAGLSGEISATVRVNPGMRFVNAEGTLLVDWPRPSGEGPQAWNTSYRFHQPFIENILREGVKRYGRIDVRLGTEVTKVEQGRDFVSLETIDTSGRDSTIKASYVVGCDGGRSTVRRAMGVGSSDLGSHDKWLVVDLLLKGARDDLGDFTVQHCDPERPTTYIRMVENRRRWEFMLMPDDNPEEIAKPETVWKLLAPWIGNQEADIERTAVYTFHAVIAESWRSGRLLLAGDAAHQTPPFLGQGMCAGIRDAANLAWKMVSVIRDGVPPDLLDSYQQEREPHVRHYIELAIRLGGVLQNTDPSKARERDEVLAIKPERLVSARPALGKSCLNQGGQLAGTLTDQLRLADGSRLDDRVGYAFAILATSSFAAELGSIRVDFPPDTVVVALDGPGEHYLEKLGAQAVVVRPDRYILATVNTVAELTSLQALQRLCQHDRAAA
ncbi:3-(3-hydroxy-phenyl)propionate hydroxylase [Rhizobium sp. SJZ105]|uniref:bifunctional 3-(3-hydroxy-phenyl)propionate/3-hydroxycinnamic acid hydroxylase MhpA n=1 Tax=Rhizobium sp. SJZ105 TaxID=2572678 RepID=UPI00119D4753|nr:bifunctional 3-(3-hydroxy-phenyl)propionate/3-hydroxycinnamic acid hydroxylase [Rhizobium sp. SJZ105]TWC76448.1 3-(3-hydroxy-phenyl)propionate hydroxylase [Rhizobium sp. SJZ105]